MKYGCRLLQRIVIVGLVTQGVAASATLIRNPSLHPSGQKADLNQRMVRFCRARLGTKVGSGQCADLTAKALPAIGAAAEFADFPASGDYVWGTLISKLEVKNGKKSVEAGGGGKSADKIRDLHLKPGDIIQFRDAVFQGRLGRGTYRRMCPHHTAVIEQVTQDGASCKVLEQNTSGKLYVIENELRLPDLSAGWVRIYRPMEKTSVPTAKRRQAQTR